MDAGRQGLNAQPWQASAQSAAKKVPRHQELSVKQKALLDQAAGGAQSHLSTAAWHLPLCVTEPQGQHLLQQAVCERVGLLSFRFRRVTSGGLSYHMAKAQHHRQSPACGHRACCCSWLYQLMACAVLTDMCCTVGAGVKVDANPYAALSDAEDSNCGTQTGGPLLLTLPTVSTLYAECLHCYATSPQHN